MREIKEELDIDIEVLDIYKVVQFSYKEKEILLLCYLCRIKRGEGKTLECNDFRWLTREQLAQYEFVPADLPIVEKLLNDEGLFAIQE